MAKAKRVARKHAAEEIEQKVGALKALTQTHSILLSATYPPNLFKVVMNSIAFVEQLHKQMLDECLANPEIASRPEFIRAQSHEATPEGQAKLNRGGADAQPQA